MAVSVIYFFQPGCMGYTEQGLINREVDKGLCLKIEEIDAIKEPGYIKR